MGVIKYLVLKKLAGKEHYLQALYEYLVYNESPSELEYRYKINRRLIAAMRQMIREMNPIYGMEIARRAIPIILRSPMPQLVIGINGEIHFYCRVCGFRGIGIYPEDHIVKKHQAALKYYATIIKTQLRGLLHG